MVDYDKFSDPNDPVEAIEEASKMMEFDEWLQVCANGFNSGMLTDCQKVDLFGMPVEAFCVDTDLVEVVDTVDIQSQSWGDLKAEVDYVLERTDVDLFNKAIGIHATSMGKANSILDSGLEGYTERGVDGFTERNGSLFFWPHYTDVGTMTYDHPDGIVVAAPAEHVRVSSYMNEEMLGRGIITPDQYDEHHTLDYFDYVECVEDGHYADRVVGPGTLF